MFFLILSYILPLFIIWFVWDLMRSRDTPPGPIKLPLLGTLLQVTLADPVPHKAFQKLSQKYGEVMSIKLGFTDAIVLNSFRTIKEIFLRDETQARPAIGPWWDRNLRKDLGIVFSSEEVWSKVNKFVTSGLRQYGFGLRNSMESVIHEELDEFCDHLRNLAESNPKNIVHFDIMYHLSFLNMVLSMVVGKRYSCDDKRLQYVMDNVKHFFKSGVTGAGVMTAYPFLRFLFPSLTGYNIQMEGVRAYQSYARDILKEHRERGDYKREPQCFADEFIRQIEENKNDPDTIFTEDQFQVIVTDFIQAGSETPSNVLGVGMLHVTIQQEIQKKLYDEVCTVVGTDRMPCVKDLGKMIYAQAVILEAHRVSTVLPHLGLRMVTRDFYYDNYLLRKGTYIFPNIPTISLDKEFWGDPDVFRPERFIGANGEVINADRNLNFGAGRRACFGETLAKDSMLLFLTTLIQKFKFTIPEDMPTPRTDPMMGFSFSTYPYDAKVELR